MPNSSLKFHLRWFVRVLLRQNNINIKITEELDTFEEKDTGLNFVDKFLFFALNILILLTKYINTDNKFRKGNRMQ